MVPLPHGICSSPCQAPGAVADAPQDAPSADVCGTEGAIAAIGSALVLKRRDSAYDNNACYSYLPPHKKRVKVSEATSVSQNSGNVSVSVAC